MASWPRKARRLSGISTRRTMMVTAMIAATTARAPRAGVRKPVNPETRWYAASTGTPNRLVMRNGLPAGTNWVLEAAAVSAGQRDEAAAGAAVGALGLFRPAASGSRCRKNAARQDFSRSAEARRISGIAAASPDTLATEATSASTAARMAPARAAGARPVRAAEPDGPPAL